MIDTTKYTQLLILKRHWVLAVTVALTVVMVAIPIALGAPDIYRAGAKLTIQRQAANSAAQAAIAGGLETRLQVIRQDALSRGHIIKLIDQLDLYPELRARSSLDVVIDRVQRDITVVPQTASVGNGTQVVLSFTVGYVGSEPEMTAAVANKLASFWVEQNTTLRAQQVSQAVQIYKAQLDEAQKGLDAANARMQAYVTSSPSQVPDSVVAKVNELGRVNAELIAKNTELTQLKIAHNTYVWQITEETDKSTTVGTTPDQQRLATLKSKAEQLKATGEDPRDGPTLPKVNRDIAALEAKIKADSGQADGSNGSSRLSVLRGLFKQNETELNAATDAVTKLEGKVSNLNAQITNAPVRNPQYDALKGDIAVASEMLASVKKSYDRAQLDAVSEKSQDSEEFAIEEPARVPTIPWGPNRLNLMIAGVFAAIVLGIGMAVLRDQLDTSFHTLDELRMFTSVPVLGSIPKITTPQQKASRVALLAVAASGLVVVLAGVSVATYRYAQRHEGITRILTK